MDVLQLLLLVEPVGVHALFWAMDVAPTWAPGCSTEILAVGHALAGVGWMNSPGGG